MICYIKCIIYMWCLLFYYLLSKNAPFKSINKCAILKIPFKSISCLLNENILGSLFNQKSQNIFLIIMKAIQCIKIRCNFMDSKKILLIAYQSLYSSNVSIVINFRDKTIVFNRIIVILRRLNWVDVVFIESQIFHLNRF